MRERLTDSYNIHDFLTVRTNDDLPVPDYFAGSEASSNSVLDVVRVQSIDSIEHLRPRRLASHRYWRSDDALAVEYPSTPTGKQVAVRLKGIETDHTTVQYTPAFRKMADFDGLFEGLLTVKLQQEDVSLIHAGGVAQNGVATLFASMGRMGKTSTILSLLAERPDLTFLGDNVLLMDTDGIAYAWPATLGVFPGTAVRTAQLPSGRRHLVELKRLIARSELLSALLLHKFSIDLSENVEPTQVASGIERAAPVRHLYLLNGGRAQNGTRVLESDEAAAKIATGTDMELDPDDYYLSLYAFTSDERDVQPSVVKQRRQQLLFDSLDAIDVTEIYADDVLGYVDLVSSS